MSLGLKLNNPGDIRCSNIMWLGKVAPSRNPDFETFDCIENGIRAVGVTLLTYFNVHGLKTLREMANRYAPPSENNTTIYVETLADRTGFDPDYPLSFPNDLEAVVASFLDAEQGHEVSQITPEQISEGVKRAIASEKV